MAKHNPVAISTYPTGDQCINNGVEDSINAAVYPALLPNQYRARPYVTRIVIAEIITGYSFATCSTICPAAKKLLAYIAGNRGGYPRIAEVSSPLSYISRA